MSFEIIILSSLVIFVGALVQSLIGFGMAVVSTPLLYLIEPALVPAPVIIMGFSTALLTLFREGRGLEFSPLQYALLGRIPGGILGAILLLVAPQPLLGLAIAAIVALAVTLSIFRFSLPINRRTLFGAGIISGIFGNIAAIGGPPMAILLAGKDPKLFRAALSAFFIFSSLIALIILGFAGLITKWHFTISLIFLPAVFLGYLLANRLVGHIDKQRVRSVTLLLCGLSALLLTGKSLLALFG
ncbi:sulfite exporter TauE/SafE family protein [Shewanella sp. AS1]|uniref:sulfite exporter TauE/SafE family protein n=1 Tax=Shewanella sp. AS1 TaxID=2907626 RepID=UPI001F491A12|nr:sulfite exporter TauE/SafE family protein [Shewanella sp. AS1]MCE9679254.1 sulfite exporter TauE/SafE family protein [Shewanella sp. AS1]